MAEYFIPIADCARYNPNHATVTATGYNVSLTAATPSKTVGFYVPEALLPAGYKEGTFGILYKISNLRVSATPGYVNGAGQKIAQSEFPWSDDIPDGRQRILIYVDLQPVFGTSPLTAALTDMGLTVAVPDAMRPALRLGGEEIAGVYLGSEEVTGAYLGDKKLF